jgi:hypothetical protein
MDFFAYSNLRNSGGIQGFDPKTYIESLGLRSSADFQMPDSRGVLVDGVLLEADDMNYLFDVAQCVTNAPLASRRDRDETLNFTQSPIEGIRNINAKLPINIRYGDTVSGGRSLTFMSNPLNDFLESQEIGSGYVYVNMCSGVGKMSWSDNAERSYLNILVGTHPFTGNHERTVDLPRTVFGIDMPFTPKGFAPNTEAAGKPIVNITDGTTVVAQYYPNGWAARTDRKVLHILFPIHPGVEAFKQIFLRIFDQLTRLNVVTNELTPDILAKMKSATVRSSMRNLEQEVTNLAVQRSDAQQTFFALIKKHRERSAELEMYKNGVQDSMFVEKATKELESIKQMDIITKMTADASGRKVKIETADIYCYNSRAKTNHLIGRMRITIDMAATDMSRAIQWYNLDRRGYSQHHAPHVDSSGKACLGNMSEMLPEVLASGDLGIIALLAIQFVQSVNFDDVWGRGIVAFPVVDKDNKIIEARGPDFESPAR